MEALMKGDIVVIDFPFSDNSGSKIRPALILNPGKDDDVIVCRISRQSQKDNFSILLKENDIDGGSLNKVSVIRVNKIFTIHKKKISYKIGSLKKNKQIVKKLKKKQELFN